MCYKLEIWYVSTNRYLVSENIHFSTRTPLILLTSAFFGKKLVFFGKSNYLYSKQWCESCVRDFLVTFSLFIRQKVFVKENVGIIGHACESRLPDCSKLTINWKNDDGIIIFWHGVIVKLFWGCRVSLVGFSYWFKFHVNITTDSGVMTICFKRD